MKKLNDLLLLGNPLLYEVSEPVQETEFHLVPGWAEDLHNVMEEIRAKYGFGRAIAAPQLGIMKRVIYMNIDKPVIIINPELSNLSDDTFELWDDCMSLPELFVKVKRHRRLTLNFTDENREKHVWNLSDDLSELIQHENDHLDGILCTMRALDGKSFKWRKRN
ncbi:MAG: peptide deformylase [Ignavibacteria bacterium]|nr:peptide deformylase [Ignavibacteria bacterium]